MEHNTEAAPFVRIGLGIARAWRFLLHAMEVGAERRHLADLDDAALKDLGISRAQARFEASRPAWDLGTPEVPSERRPTMVGAYHVAAE